MTVWRALVIGIGFAVSVCGAAAPANESISGCDNLLPASVDGHGPNRPISALDLLRLRDIIGRFAPGPGGPYQGSAIRTFGLSADGRSLALMLGRADPATNSYCYGVVVVDLAGDTAATLVDQWQEVTAEAPVPDDRIYVRRQADFAPPIWSSDGMFVAFLKRIDGVINVWHARTDGRGAEQVSRSTVDVDDLAWSADSRSIIYASRLGRAGARQAIDEEGNRGWHFDDRWIPVIYNRPLLPVSIETEYRAIDLESGRERPASEDESALIPSYRGQRADRPRPAAVNNRGDHARIVSDPRYPFSTNRLRVELGIGTEIECRVSVCSNIVDVWWTPDGELLHFLRREGPPGQRVMYRWRPGQSDPARTFNTVDRLFNCERVSDGLVCAHEAPTTPLRLVRLDPDNGAMRALFDPNPETASWRFGSVEHLEWRTENGTEMFGHLVLPPDHRPGQRLPLVVVGYQSSGFLRGGSDDAFPIQAFAARGFAVLSYDRPVDDTTRVRARNGIEMNRAEFRDWRDRRNVQSGLEAGIALLRARGLIDEERIGLTGFSEGAQAAGWAIINSDLFATVSFSDCCTGNPTSIMGGMWGWEPADRWHSWGFPRLSDNDDDFYRPYALELNTERVDIPILIQASDTEFRGVFPALGRFRELGRPVDMYVFPREGHIKWEPVHRLAQYERNLDWFDFWLRGVENQEPGRSAEYARWRAWRDQSARPNTGSPR